MNSKRGATNEQLISYFKEFVNYFEEGSASVFRVSTREVPHFIEGKMMLRLSIDFEKVDDRIIQESEPAKKVFEIWAEGYQFHPFWERGGARLFGKVEAGTFKEACALLAETNDTFAESYDQERMTWWGCRLFDNEKDARARYG